MWKHALPVLIGCLAATASGQSVQHVPAKITLRTDSPAVFAGAPINVTVELLNISDHLIGSDIERVNGKVFTYGFSVTDQNGVSPKATQTPNDEPIIASTITIYLKPSQRDVSTICLSCQFGNLSAPGKYSIYAFRAVQDDGKSVEVKSNELTITVLPKRADGSQ